MKRFLSFIVSLALTMSLVACRGSTTNWSEIVLADALPIPASTKIETQSNSTEELYGFIKNISPEQYTDYVKACKDAGYTIYPEESRDSFKAYNEAGYYLDMFYDEYGESITMDFEAPKAMSAFVWPTRENAKQLPLPKSSVAYVRNENDFSYELFVGESTFEDYKDYVRACQAKGFTIDAEETAHTYHALNDEEYELTLEHHGGNVLYIEIVENRVDVEIKLLHTDKSSADMYNLRIEIDDVWEEDSKKGDEAITIETALKKGKHTLIVEYDDDDDINGRVNFVVTEDGEYFEFEITCLSNKIDITNVNNSTSDFSEQPSKDSSTEPGDDDVIQNTNSSDDSASYNNIDTEQTFTSNGRFTFTPRSFIERFDKVDKEAKGYNYTYMRMNGETSLFYELAEISGGYTKVRSAGMVSFVKGVDTTLTIEEDYTENIITKINVLVEDVDDVPPILVGCMCATDPALDFETASDLGMDVVEKAGTKDGYVHNGIKYVVAVDGEYYYIIISIDKAPILAESNEKNTANKDNEATEDNHDNEDNVSSVGVNKLTVSSTNVSLNNSSQAISITVPDSYDGDINCTVENSDILSTSWGGWNGNTVTLTLIPKTTGSTSIEIHLGNGDSVVVDVCVSVTDYLPNAADYTTLRIAPATYYTFNDDEGYSSDIVLLESADYKVSDNGDGTVNITISGTMQRKTNNISTYIQIGYSLYIDGEDIKDGTVGIDAPNLNQSYNYTLELEGLRPGNYIIYFTSY